MDQRLSELIEDLTTSGEPRLDPERMKELKRMCRYGLGSAAPRLPGASLGKRPKRPPGRVSRAGGGRPGAHLPRSLSGPAWGR